jgi:hypothetical protein
MIKDASLIVHKIKDWSPRILDLESLRMPASERNYLT